MRELFEPGIIREFCITFYMEFQFTAILNDKNEVSVTPGDDNNLCLHMAMRDDQNFAAITEDDDNVHPTVGDFILMSSQPRGMMKILPQ